MSNISVSAGFSGTPGPTPLLLHHLPQQHHPNHHSLHQNCLGPGTSAATTPLSHPVGNLPGYGINSNNGSADINNIEGSNLSNNGSSGPLQQQRSTRGASKQRRDQINVEIQKLRDLLPLSDLIKDRLFQLQVMSLGCIFIRKHRYQQTAMQHHMVVQSAPTPRGIDICKALRGFMMMVTRSGKILHVSDNASEYLGHSVEEIMCQGDSIYDLVDLRDHAAVQAELASGPPTASNFPEERVFICRLNLARTAKRQLQYHKFVLLQGRYIQPAEYYQSLAAQTSQPECDQPVFSSFCQPLINPENAESMATGNTNVFCTQHYLDMKFKESDPIASHHLGYSREKLKGLSWYEMLHPNHVPEIAYKHRLLCQEKEGSVLALIRLQSSSGEWVWLHTVFSIRQNNEVNSDGKRVRHVIYCFHQKLSELEAATLQANSWIYSMRHTYPTVFSCQDSPTQADEVQQQPQQQQQQQQQRPLSPPTPPYKDVAEQKPIVYQNHGVDYNQIKVEIPMRAVASQIPLFTPESSSPESSASLHSSLFANSFHHSHVEILEDIMPANDVLPELRDEVDEILRQVEQSDDFLPPANVNLAHRHSMPSIFDNRSSELYKYLGPALFENSSDNHDSIVHHHQPPMSCPPPNQQNLNFHNNHANNIHNIHNNHINNNNNNADNNFHQNLQPYPNFDYYNRKRSWAV